MSRLARALLPIPLLVAACTTPAPAGTPAAAENTGAPAAAPAPGRVNGQQARQLVTEGARVIDVRSPEEFASGHIEGAVNIPVDALSSRLGELGAKDGALVVYCRSGSRSSAAMRSLQSSGFTRVYDLGPMSAW